MLPVHSVFCVSARCLYSMPLSAGIRRQRMEAGSCKWMERIGKEAHEAKGTDEVWRTNRTNGTNETHET